MLYKEAREVAKAVASSALAASLQGTDKDLDKGIISLLQAGGTPSFFANFGTVFSTPTGKGLNLPGVAAAAANAGVGMNNIQDLQMIGLSTSRHMRGNPSGPVKSSTTNVNMPTILSGSRKGSEKGNT